MRPATLQAPRFSFCAKTLEQSRVFFFTAALLAGCSSEPAPVDAPPPAAPTGDFSAVERDYPALAGRIVPARQAAPAPVPAAAPETRWRSDNYFVVRAPCTMRVGLPGEEAREIFSYDGHLDLVGVGTVRAEGLTIGQVRDEIERRLTRLLRRPEASVEVLETVRPPLERIAVDVAGWVRRPGRLDRILRDARLEFAVAGAGGMRDGAAAEQIVVLRGDRAIVCNVVDDPEGSNPPLEDGDIVFAPAACAPDAPYAPTWNPIAAWFAGRIGREELLRALNEER